MSRALVVVIALASACYSTGGAKSRDEGGSAGNGGTAGVAAGAGAGAGGAGARGGAGGTGGGSGNGGNAGSGGALAGTAGEAFAGASPSGGQGGSAGSGGSSGEDAGRLGQACVSDNECGTTGLTCLEHDEFDGSGPPKGLCTIPCSNDVECNELARGAFCIGFPDGQSYCIESCELGVSGEPKCNEREEFGCGLVGQLPGSRSCETSEDCDAGQLCAEGVCNDAITACVPVCGGDYDCGAGQYCDFVSGFCVAAEPEGLPIGASCDPAAEADPCLGFCVAVSDVEGMCSAACTSNTSASGCGFNGTSSAEAVCVWVPVYADPQDVGLGDTLFCGAMCECNDECAIEGWGCFAADTILGAGASNFFGRAGLCAPIADNETIDDTLGACLDPGAGGAGGGSGAGGEPGTSGAPAAGSAGEAGQGVAAGAGGAP